MSSLRAEVEVRHDRWLRLYSEPDVLPDPEKRKRMHRARWDYQEALLAYLAYQNATNWVPLVSQSVFQEDD